MKMPKMTGLSSGSGVMPSLPSVKAPAVKLPGPALKQAKPKPAKMSPMPKAGMPAVPGGKPKATGPGQFPRAVMW